MSASVHGQVALITGGARGIGQAIAHRLGGAGARILVVDHDGPAVDQAVTRLSDTGIAARALAGDVGEQDTATAAVQAALTEWGRIDILINNAGIIGPTGPLATVPVADLDRVYRVNLRGTYLFCQAVVSHMQSQSYGRIVNIASIAGKEGNPFMIPYSVTKAAVMALTKALAKEVAGEGILVNCVTPAVVRTRIWEQTTPEQMDALLAKIPMGRSGSVEEVAALVCWLASGECSFSTGAVFDISGGRATY